MIADPRFRCGVGQGDHAGEHITYKRTGDSLLIIGDFLRHGTPSRMEWRMTRAGD